MPFKARNSRKWKTYNQFSSAAEFLLSDEVCRTNSLASSPRTERLNPNFAKYYFVQTIFAFFKISTIRRGYIHRSVRTLSIQTNEHLVQLMTPTLRTTK